MDPIYLQLDGISTCHLANNPSIHWRLPLLNHWHDLQEALFAEDLLHVYNFDGELDDQLRLESVLLGWDRTKPIIILAGRRIDGDDTLDEMKMVCDRVFGGQVATEQMQNLYLMAGGPLVVKTDEDRSTLEQTVNALQALLQRLQRPFVFHNNTSATVLEHILKAGELQSKLKAVTNTCGVATPPNGTFLGANASWNLTAFLDSINVCQEANIPFISIHGSLNGWSKTTLPELNGWAEAMLRPVKTKQEQLAYQNVTRFSMGMCLSWTVRAAFWSTASSKDAFAARVRDLLKSIGRLPDPEKPQPSDAWTTWTCEELEELDLENMTSVGTGARARSVAINSHCPFSNTIGDLSACVADHPSDTFGTVALSVNNLERTEQGWQMTLGDGETASNSTHYVIARAEEADTLERAWSTIRSARLAAKPGQYEIVDEVIKEEWKDFARIMELLLDEILEHDDRFEPDAVQWWVKAAENISNGYMAQFCQAPANA